jgi:hypothetical protein
MTNIDAKLRLLLAAAATAPDETFVKRVDSAVIAEERMIAAQAALWRRFAVELAGTIAIVAAFYLLWKITPSGIAIDPLMQGPGVAASMTLLLWLIVQLKQPAATR